MKPLELRKQYDYYVSNEKELLVKYDGKTLVITDSLDVYSFEDAKEAYIFGMNSFGAGNFLLQKCSPDVLNIVNTVNYAL